MVKKLFALASVTALTGLVSAVGVAGCSNDDTPVTPSEDAGTPDAKKDSKAPVTVPDSGDDTNTTPDCANTTGAAFSLAAAYKYTSPGPKEPNSCTKDQITAAVAAIKTKSDKQASVDVDVDVAPHIEGDAGSCVACLKGSNTAWRVSNQTTTPQDPYYYNFHGCLQLKGAIDATCAEALYTLNLCINYVCLQSCTNNADQNACATWAQQEGDCKDINTSSCTFISQGKSVTDLQNENGCGAEADIITAFCGEEE